MNDHPSNEMELRVRYAEVDQMGFLHHSRYWVYFEMGRIELLRQTGVSYKQCEESGVFLVVAKANVRYRSPARYDDVLLLKTHIEKVGMARIDHAYELRRKEDNALIATAETTLGCIDRDGNITPLPEFVRDACENERTDDAPDDKE